VHAGAHATTLRAPLEGRGLGLGDLVAATLADQLVDGWHRPAFLVDYAVSGRLFTNCMAGFRAVLARPTTFLASRGRACRARDGTRNPGTPERSAALAGLLQRTNLPACCRAQRSTILAACTDGQSGPHQAVRQRPVFDRRCDLHLDD